MNQRPRAIPSVQSENDKVIVTEYRFSPGAETGFHRHKYDYVIVPMTNGTLLVETEQGKVSDRLVLGQSYPGYVGTEHNVVNISDHDVVFVEIEIK